MANIGSFKKSGDELHGNITTLTFQAKGVRIIPVTKPTGHKAPSHRVYLNASEIGAAWTNQTNDGRDFLSITLDDPGFAAPVHANLFRDEDGQGFTLTWTRDRRNGRG